MCSEGIDTDKRVSLNEKREKIKELRLKREKYEKKLYLSQMELVRFENILLKRSKGEIKFGDKDEIEKVRAEIANKEASLRVLNRKLAVAANVIDKIKLNKSRVNFLKKKKISVEAHLKDANKMLKEIKGVDLPARPLLKKLAEEIAKLDGVLKELEPAIKKADNELTLLKEKEQGALKKRDEIAAKKKEFQDKIIKNEEDLGALLKADNYKMVDLLLEINKIRQVSVENKKAAVDANLELNEKVGGIYLNTDPRDLVEGLDDTSPFLLMPVRIETRFVKVGEDRELWLRVYPDDIAVHTHEKLLTDKEVIEGTDYWKTLLDAEKKGGEAGEEKKKAAWSELSDLFGPQRSAWVASQTRPDNWSDDLVGVDDEAELVFPVHDNTKINAWTRAPRTKVLPDKFVVMLYEGDDYTSILGEVIPDELSVGPAPLEVDESFVDVNDKLLFGESFDWTSDFDKAVSLGMGFKKRLSSAQARDGFDKILVLGLYLSADEEDGQRLIEELIENHHYSPDGFSLIKQGTPTNNTETDGSGYTKNDQFGNISYFVETGKPLFTSNDDCDGRILADALGIEYGPLQYILNSDATDYKQAAMMNKALYPATLGYYFESLMRPVFKRSDQLTIRHFFENFVTGRGHLPSIRVGNQPYGVLLTSDFSRWRWGKGESLYNKPFLEKLRKLLSHYQDIWDELLDDLMYVGKPGVDPSEVLMNIIGLQAGSVTFSQRIAYSSDYLKNLDDFQYDGEYFDDLSSSYLQKGELLNFFNKYDYNTTDESTNGLVVPQALRLIYQHYSTALDSSNLVDNVPLSEDEAVRYYDETAGENYLHWLGETSSVDDLERQNFGDGITAPNTLLYMNLRRALLLQLHLACVEWLSDNNFPKLMAKPTNLNFNNLEPNGNVTKYEVMRATLGTAVPGHEYKDMSVGDYLLTTGQHVKAAHLLTEMREALKSLADVGTAKLERCFSEHLDLCTYRLDAWQTAIFQLRLMKQRNLLGDGAKEGRRKGINIGAYGWLEDVHPGSGLSVTSEDVPEKLRPSEGQELFEEVSNGGFVHTPSLDHASAAAVLRSGYLTHADSENPEMMAVNLSSERVRRALFILEGIRNGQTTEALLGYQFERGLHDRASADSNLMKLNLFIYDFREKFIYEEHIVRQQGSPDASTASIPANCVVNGVTLSETDLPFPYGAGGAVTGATPEERVAIEQEKDRLSDTADAVKDLLLMESTYQMVRGNFDRSGAVMNSLKEAHRPPEIESINTPRSSNFTFTNRVTVQFEKIDPDLASSNPWETIAMTPRARMEAGLNKWLSSMLGDPSGIVYKVAHLDDNGDEAGSSIMTLEDLALQAIDIVYITGNELNTGGAENNNESRTAVSELESRIAYVYRDSNVLDDEAVVRIEFMKPVVRGKKTLGVLLPLLRMLKSMASDSRHLNAEDFDPMSKESLADRDNPKGYDADELKGRVESCAALFKLYLDELYSLSIVAEIVEEDGTVHVYSTLKGLFDALDLYRQTFNDIHFTFTAEDAIRLQGLLMSISAYGIADSFPKTLSPFVDENNIVLLSQAKSVARTASDAYTKAMALIGDASSETTARKKVDKLLEAGKALLQDVFNILPLFTYSNEADIQESNGDRAQLLKYAVEDLKMTFAPDEWLQNASHVRPRLARWEYIRTLIESFNMTTLELKPVQVPYRKNDSWLAVEFPKTYEVTIEKVDEVSGDIVSETVSEPFNITHDTLSILVHGDSAFFSGATQSGLLIDDWTEVIPSGEEVTGITFNYNRPNSSPPQALLLAVTPEEKGYWTWDDLVGILNDTLQRAKRRAVEPVMLDKVKKAEVGVLLPSIVSDFSEYDLNISLDYRLNIGYYAAVAPILNVYDINSDRD